MIICGVCRQKGASVRLLPSGRHFPICAKCFKDYRRVAEAERRASKDAAI